MNRTLILAAIVCILALTTVTAIPVRMMRERAASAARESAQLQAVQPASGAPPAPPASAAPPPSPPRPGQPAPVVSPFVTKYGGMWQIGIETNYALVVSAVDSTQIKVDAFQYVNKDAKGKELDPSVVPVTASYTGAFVPDNSGKGTIKVNEKCSLSLSFTDTPNKHITVTTTASDTECGFPAGLTPKQQWQKGTDPATYAGVWQITQGNARVTLTAGKDAFSLDAEYTGGQSDKFKQALTLVGGKAILHGDKPGCNLAFTFKYVEFTIEPIGAVDAKICGFNAAALKGTYKKVPK